MTLPKWVQALEKAPRGQAVMGAMGVTFAASGMLWAIMMASGKSCL